MLIDYASANGQELWNTARTEAYLRNVGSPFTSGPSVCRCPTLTAEILGDLPYTTPQGDPAPWYDADVPASASFLGFLPLEIEGIDDNPRTRSVSNAVGGGGVFGAVREQPRTMVVRGLLLGATCCGADYGLSYLAQILAGCTGSGCDGDCLQMFNCCPDEGMTQNEFNAAHRRTFQRVALVDGPTVLRRRGSGDCASSNCAAGGEILEVEFTLVAANPWAWSDYVPYLDTTMPPGGQGECVQWCVTSSGSCGDEPCLFSDCGASADCAQDPLLPIVTPPEPTMPSTAFCTALVPETECYEIDLGSRPRWSEDVPIITIFSGASEIRNFRVAFYEKPAGAASCQDQQNDFTCESVNEINISYIPANSTVTVDGQTGTASIDCGNGCQPSSSVFGDQDGGPLRIETMTCDLYCVCISVDATNPVADDARVEIGFTGRGF